MAQKTILCVDSDRHVLELLSFNLQSAGYTIITATTAAEATVRVKPGETAWSNSFNLGNWYSVDTVWVGISKIVFDDGEIRDVDDVEYYSCVMPSKK